MRNVSLSKNIDIIVTGVVEILAVCVVLIIERRRRVPLSIS